MGIGLGGFVGGAIGGVGGFLLSGGNPYAAIAGFSAGVGLFEGDDASGLSDARRAQLAEARANKKQWDDRYGAIEETLARSIRDMTVESVSAAGLQAVEQEYSKVGTSIRRNVSQRHLEGSGIEQELKFQADLSKAEARADVRADAPDKIRESQSKFLALGLQSKDRQSQEGRILGLQAEDARIADNRASRQRGGLLDFAGNLLGSQDVKLGNIDIPDFDFNFDFGTKSQLDLPFDDLGVLDNLTGGTDYEYESDLNLPFDDFGERDNLIGGTG